jgi:twitching motility protein PilT
MQTEHPASAKDAPPSIATLVRHAHANKASDIHLRVGEVPRYRIRGQLVPFGKQWKLTPEIFEQYLMEILTPEQIQEFVANKELDTAIFYPGFLRCRINCFESLTGGAIVMRLISLDVPSIYFLVLPPVFKKIASSNQGLILVTGATGSGKSTTLAAMIRHLNETTHKHIVTIEDPIEFVHTSQNCLISQREVGLHTQDFHNALRSVLREDPDVILIGEMRDRITVNIALQAAQTGHLVLGSLHTRNAINAINRLLNLYEANEQQAMRIQITESLIAVIAQMLVPTTDQRRMAVHEILINTPAIHDYLLKGEEDEVLRLMETNTTEGMQVLNHALYEQVLSNRITTEEAKKASPDPYDLDRRLRTGDMDGSSLTREFGR